MEIRSFLIVLMMSKFNIFASDSKSYVRIHQVRSCIQNPESYNKAFNGSVMVWCTFSTAGPGILHFIQGAMNPNTYRDIFKTKFSQCVQEMSLALCDSRDKNSSPSTTGKTCKPKIPAHQSEEKLGSEERDEFASIPSGVALATSAAGYF
ncbi:hypothetical protein CEXT_396641 [Caerostris extrusa]|uniref:Uncharacterized protein n=1 Tax=Caerostris extrusa TaxID=172846 RepID=A0AAV4N5T1_CAEEX|nr:hypothetical protein CEXT_396641 [Caerostris extrusa]